MKTHKSVFPVFLAQLYEQYSHKFAVSVLRREVMRPWMKAREISLIHDLLTSLRPQQCLEWGAGYSTLTFPQFLDSGARWISIEHEKDWFEKIAAKNARANVGVCYVAPNHVPWSDPAGDGAYTDLVDYIKFPESHGKFDFILVDGRARNECVRAASSLLSERGVVLVHDANRKMYEEPWKQYRYQALFRDYRDIVGGFWIGSQSLDINTLLDVRWYQELWRFYERAGRTGLGRLLRP